MTKWGRRTQRGRAKIRRKMERGKVAKKQVCAFVCDSL